MGGADQDNEFVGQREGAFDYAGMAVVIRLEPANKDQEIVRFVSHSKLLTVTAVGSIPVAIVVYIVHY